MTLVEKQQLNNTNINDKMNWQNHILIVIATVMLTSCLHKQVNNDNDDNIIIENKQIKLVIGKDGKGKSLLYKPTNEECFKKGENISIFSITQERPYNNEVKLAHVNKKNTFDADTIYRNEDKLIVGFETIPYEAVVKVSVTNSYIRFSLEDFIVDDNDYLVNITPPPVYEMCFLQLPVKNREHFGEWLNVSWDAKLSVNVLGTDQYAKIDAVKCKGFHIMKASAVKDIKLKGVGAALIVCNTDNLLDNIAQVEDDYNLPKGVESRRNKHTQFSYYWSSNVNPGNVDEHIKYIKMCGLHNVLLNYGSFIEADWFRKLGNYDWIKSEYPNEKEDLKKMLNKISGEGIVPGFHFLHTHIGRESRYISPIPDYRLNLLKRFNLSKSLSNTDTIIYVEQNPQGLTMADKCRVLKIGTELITYENYTTTYPYKFIGCKRGIDKTTVNSQPLGYMFGLLDVSEFSAHSVYINQNTSLPDEIAEKIADIYQAGFRFVYFDGSEGVNKPFWYNVAAAQYKVYKRLKPKPYFGSGAAKTHFSWHLMAGGNAFDIFEPEVLKESIRKYPAKEAEHMKDDFTIVNFGWLGYFVPDENTIGTQPDMLEYVTSRAAAWDCPVAIHGVLESFKSHARTPDNLEVLRRWEEVRAQNWLTKKQKDMLQDLNQEHILLINEEKEFELLPYNQINDVANGSREVRAFIFERKDDLYVVYWHISGDKKLKLNLPKESVTLLDESTWDEIPVDVDKSNHIVVPVSNRLFLKTNKLTKKELISAFRNAQIAGNHLFSISPYRHQTQQIH